ncbi:shikimate kinase II [Rouxiella silvae]|uniref:Shikimate kinase 2 n=1 Tax=Rouxiella silvae TaxID=1646373 RepID=A0AA41BUV7_9GAMM|nr:shikimate kinase AroL [Rouxiella silvae]KQN47366.1 shikimate kinase [Serratia sp. Leaf50]MBF6635157.1 shikimate kinase AroL [Rouxiella silvae]ORJ22414.1 shikimate kinase II [Rouxiella silvae]
MTQPIFMIGARGAGKTTVGRALAQTLGYDFVDTDIYLLQTSQLSVAEIVAREGWSGFRRRETQALQNISAPNTVVATGGGVILAEENRQFMREKGQVIYLRSPASTLAHRLEDAPQEDQRPTLTGKPINEEISEVLNQREALYQEAAHFVVDGTHQPSAIVEDILDALALQIAR